MAKAKEKTSTFPLQTAIGTFASIIGIIGVSFYTSNGENDTLPLRVLFFLSAVGFPFVAYYSAKSERKEIGLNRALGMSKDIHQIAHLLRELNKANNDSDSSSRSKDVHNITNRLVVALKSALNNTGLSVDHVCFKVYDQTSGKLYTIARSEKSRIREEDKTGESVFRNPFFAALLCLVHNYKDATEKFAQRPGHSDYTQVKSIYPAIRPTIHFGMHAPAHTCSSEIFQSLATEGLKELKQQGPISSAELSELIRSRMPGKNSFQVGVAVMDKTIKVRGDIVNAVNILGFIGVDGPDIDVSRVSESHIELIAGVCDLLYYNFPDSVDYTVISKLFERDQTL